MRAILGVGVVIVWVVINRLKLGGGVPLLFKSILLPILNDYFLNMNTIQLNINI